MHDLKRISINTILTDCIRKLKLDEVTCGSLAWLVDPPAPGVTELTTSLEYNPSMFTFNQAASGPLGAFSVGGGTPPDPGGMGTEPLELLPTTGYTPGARLPGSTLTYTNPPGLVTMDYQLANPVSVIGDVNFFLFDFDFVVPVTIDLAASTATYLPTGPGGSFTQASFSCTTSDGANQCGSDSPSTGITLNLATIPEPAPGPLLLAAGLAVLGVIGRGRVSLGRRRDSRFECAANLPRTTTD